MLICHLTAENDLLVDLWQYVLYFSELIWMSYVECERFLVEIWSSVADSETDWSVLIVLVICLCINIAFILISWTYYRHIICNPNIPGLVVKYSKLNTKEYKEKSKAE